LQIFLDAQAREIFYKIQPELKYILESRSDLLICFPFTRFQYIDKVNQALNTLLSMINSGPLVKLPTITDFELAIMPEDKKGIPPFTVAGSTCTCSDSEIILTSSSVAFGCIAAPIFVATIIDPV
jgi:hypothetical protein